MADEVYETDASRKCAELNGLPVWFTDEAELNWFRSIMNDFGISCVHIGENLLNNITRYSWN